MISSEIVESYINSGIDDHLKKLGYKKLGQGIDQQAWEEPNTGHVLKIFGTGRSERGLSIDQQMFYIWAKFCEENTSNPYLPKFYGIEQFKFEGDNYIQFRQEKLYRNPRFTSQLTQSLVDAVEYDESFEKWMKEVNEFASFKKVDHFKKTASMFNDPEQLQQIKDFYKLLHTLYTIGKKHHWYFDVHEDNIMMRADTTPVIVDPWVL
jgi:hypothetical protein